MGDDILIFHADCDYINGESTDGRQYDSCVYCYRYDLCKAVYEKKNYSVT